MNNTQFFVNPLRTADFVSIFNSIHILSNFFYGENLISDEDHQKPIPLVNTLCAYLLINNNIENATITLGKKLLHGTHFYGSNDDETIHFKYVDAELDNLIASVVFSTFGNTFGYMSAIVNGTNNLTLSFVKRKIEQDLSERTFFNQDYTISRLTQLSIRRITKKLIFPLFPELAADSQLRIVDVDYIYAQAGLMFARSAHIILPNTSLEEYIAIAQSIEQGVRLSHLNNSALQIFQLPALLYYTHKNPEMFKDVRFDVLINDENFWNSAFLFFFSNLDAEHQNISSIQEKNLVYLFKSALFGYRNRTDYAEFILRSMCPLADESEYRKEIDKYKYNHANYYCKTDNSPMPNINKLFSQQNQLISNHYLNVEKSILEEAFSDELIRIIKQANVTISPIDVLNRRRCGFRCEPLVENLRRDTTLFQISVNGVVKDVYALIWQNENIIILSHEKDRNEFMNKLSLKPTTVFIVPTAKKVLKYSNETFETFLTNLIEPKRLAFYNRLQDHGYESTSKESVIGFLKNLIPFYSCAQAAKTETPVITVCACIVDSLVLIPLVGQAANTGLKFFNAAVRPLLASFQSSLKSFTIGQFVGITLRNFAAQTATEFSKLLTKELFKDIGISIVRTLDPGIEFSYTLGKSGVTAVIKCFKIIGRKITSLTKVIKSLNAMKQTVVSKVGNLEGHSVFANSITGNDGYGIKYLKVRETNVELRRVRGYRNEVSVVQVNNVDEEKRIYQIIDIETGQLSSARWEAGPFDILEVERKPLRDILKIIAIEGLSGKGLIISPRIKLKRQMMETKVNIISEWSNRIHGGFISKVLDQYVLEDVGLTTNVFEHMATQGTLPDWIQYYKLNNVNDYENLRYNSYLENILLTQEEAVERAVELFKNKHRLDFTPINPNEMYEIYQLNQLHSYINFDDFCSIGNYITNGPKRALLQSPEGWLIQNAFNKLAMRLIDFPAYNVPTSFFRLEQFSVEVFETFKPGEYKKFHTVLDVDSDSSRVIEGIRTIIPDGRSVQILLEIIVDNPYMVVDLDKILPDVRTAVVLPNCEFIVDGVHFDHYVEGNLVYRIVLKNYSISKSKWIATLNQNIETLNKQIHMHNNIIDDFDINFLN